MRLVYLQSSDNKVFLTEEAAAKLSLKLKRIIEVKDRVLNEFINIDNVKGITLTKVINYCRKHVKSKDDAEALKLFDQELVRNEGVVSMMLLTDAAMNLEIESLFQLFYQALIDKLKGKTLQEIFDMFHTEDLDLVISLRVLRMLLNTVSSSWNS